MKLQQVRMIYHVCSIWILIDLIRPSLSDIVKESIKCTEGSVEADPGDCGSYFQCLDEVTLHMRCPAGSYFESGNEVCVVDQLGICPSSLRTCTEGELEVDSGNCAGYLECINGVLVKEYCPTGSYFDTSFKLCLIDENGICSNSSNHCNEGEVQVDPNNCDGYLHCVNGKLESKKCASGSYFEPNVRTCIVDVNGVCVDPPAKCTEGDLKLDPNNCAGYLKCINGEFVEEACPSGSYYSANLETCILDSEGVCLTIIRLCVEGVQERNPEDCTGYKKCVGGELVNLKCASGKYFDVNQGDCLIDQHRVCVKEFHKEGVRQDNGNSGCCTVFEESPPNKKNLCNAEVETKNHVNPQDKFESLNENFKPGKLCCQP